MAEQLEAYKNVRPIYEDGSLAAEDKIPFMRIYRYDIKYGFILRMEGWYGKKLYADIKLTYDGSGHLVSAIGSNGKVVKYDYD